MSFSIIQAWQEAAPHVGPQKGPGSQDNPLILEEEWGQKFQWVNLAPLSSSVMIWDLSCPQHGCQHNSSKQFSHRGWGNVDMTALLPQMQSE